MCGDRLAYAKALLSMEEQRSAPLRLALAARDGALISRIRRLAGQPEQRNSSAAWIAGLLSAGVTVIGLQSSMATATQEIGNHVAQAQEFLSRTEREEKLTIRDRNGVVLAHPDPASPRLRYPYGAMASHFLDSLRQYASRETFQTLDLTIDSRAQFIVENALRAVHRGTAVVVDVQTGDILAAASVPSFDPNTLTEEKRRELSEDPTEPLKNRALSESPPGATFKIVTALAGVRKGLSMNAFICTGKVLHCWAPQALRTPVEGHGALRLDEALKCSCGPFFYQYGNEAGIDEITATSKLLGLGRKSELPVADEDPGVIPDPEWLRTVSPHERWSPGYTANVSVGQGAVAATPLQMAMVTATVANRGVAYTPRILRGEPTRIQANLGKLGFRRDHIEMIRRGMWKIVNETGGTGRRAQLKTITVAGKTGAAQHWRVDGNQRHRDMYVWFVGFAPYEYPRFAISVLVEGGRSGGGTAAPIAGYILEQMLHLDPALKPAPLEAAAGSFDPVEDVQFSPSY